MTHTKKEGKERRRERGREESILEAQEKGFLESTAI
jgi:hypothetical protein